MNSTILHEKTPFRRTAFWTQEEICSSLSRLCNEMHCSEQIKESAKSICSQAYHLGLNKGRTMLSLISTSLFLALRQNGEAITLHDFLEKVGANPHQKQEITRYYRTLYNELQLDLPVVEPSSFVHDISSRVHKSPQVEESALKLIETIQRSRPEVTGRNPVAVAAAAIYVVSLDTGEKITEKEVANAAGVTEACVRNSVKVLGRKVDRTAPAS